MPCASPRNMNNVRQPIPILKLHDIPPDAPTAGCENDLPERASLVARVGDVIQIADALRVALMLADLAVKLLEQSGSNAHSVVVLRRQLLSLRRGL